MIAKSECGRVHGPNWMKWLGHLAGTPAVGMEIGTFEGDSAEFMLDNVFTHPKSAYHCVDPFTGAADHHFHGVDCSKLEQTSREKLARFKNAYIHKGFSEEVVRRFSDRLSMIYVDGRHDAMAVMRDAVLAFDLLLVGGIMVFDDLGWTAMEGELEQPKLAIDCFVRVYGKHLKVIHRGYQLAVQKTSS